MADYYGRSYSSPSGRRRNQRSASGLLLDIVMGVVTLCVVALFIATLFVPTLDPREWSTLSTLGLIAPFVYAAQALLTLYWIVRWRVAVATSQAVERIGMPEAQIILSQAVLYVATAPKSNSACNAIFAAMDNVKSQKTTVPSHLQDAHYRGSQKLGHGVGYKYAHDYPKHYVEQQYLPDEIKDARFYEPSDNGKEKQIREWMKYIHES